MLSLALVDPFATKGAEYLLVLCFLAALIVFWRILERVRPATPPPRHGRRTGRGDWFHLPDGFYFHPGHTWALPEPDGTFRVGVDDFAQKLLGPATAVRLPEIGRHLAQGEPGWKVEIDSKPVDLLSPVRGEVVELNRGVLERPALLNSDPYGSGWLLRVRPSKTRANLRNLLHGTLAQRWNALVESKLRGRVSGELGAVLQDGGVPISGIARGIAGERWREVAEEFLLTR